MQDLISIVVPVYNCEKYLEECMNSLCSQTYKNIEIICVDDGSTDSSTVILKSIAEKDSRVKILSQKNAGAGAARNYGLSVAQGKYIYFFDADDIAFNNLLELVYKRAQETDADIVAFNGYTFTNDDISTKKIKPGYNKNVLGDSSCVFSYKDYPENIISIVNVVPWNKLIRTQLIKENNIRFEEISSTNDITFSAVCVACAKRIALVDKHLMYYRLGHSGTISSTKSKKLGNAIIAVESVRKQISELEYSDELQNAVKYFAIDNYCFYFLNFANDFSSQYSKEFYTYIHEQFNSEYFSDVTEEMFTNKKLWPLYCSIKQRDYNEMLEIRSREIIVSLTSFPARIIFVSQVIDSLAVQNRKADRVILNLAKPQFPNGEADLPEKLVEQKNNGLVQFAWHDEDIRSHKKYYYVMKENPESIVITVDDDLVFKPDMIETLYYSYLCYPKYASAMRLHVMAIDTDNKVPFPYTMWFKEYRQKALAVSSQFFATSGMGTLFPPHALDKRVFNKDKFLELCPMADDVWLYFMLAINDTPYVCATTSFYIHSIEGCEESPSLSEVNVEGGMNDTQIRALMKWLDSEIGEGIAYEKILGDKFTDCFVGLKNVYKYGNVLQEKIVNINKKLNITYAEKSEINAKLQKTYKEKFQRGVEIKSLKAEIKQLSKEKAKLEAKNNSLNEQLKTYKKYEILSYYGIKKRLKRLFKRKH